MRHSQSGSVLNVRAIGGLHVVTLGWDFAEAALSKRDDLLGFAIERVEFKNGQPVERYFLRGIKRFKFKDEGLAPGTPVPTSEHPIQSFQWGDYTAKPATTYEFTVIPCYGKPKLMTLDRASATTVRITTEAEAGGIATDQTAHDIYFNRGVAGSQAFARKFGDVELDEDNPQSEPMVWLSRGLFEALTAFIGRAAQEDAADYKLRAMLYEFRYLPVGRAFKAAADAGADVDIRYEAQSYEEDNEAMIKKARIGRICTPQRSRAGIRHNKFIVLIHKDTPIAVWTGSTNISAGGIFGHSNVGHIIWDQEIAASFLRYWERLADPDVKAAALKAANLEEEATPARNSRPPADRILTLYSPRDDKDDEQTLHWYADLVANAKQMACITFAFNLDPFFEEALFAGENVLRYALFDKNPGKQVEDEVVQKRTTVIAPGAILKPGDFELFLGEKLSGFNKNLYIHDKFILLDPLGDDPVVVTGTANFSKPSQTANDENMLVIRGNTRVADIYFGEFMRVFDHLYARYIVKKLKGEHRQDPDSGFLRENAQDWVPAHFKPGPKSLRRRLFLGNAPTTR
ncbi:phospholipase D-like domain-containing protein [Bradyrhizobium sp. USDA 4353]